MAVSKKRLRITRDGVLFVCGLLGIANEAHSHLERPTLLLLFGAMIGLPAFLQKDAKNEEKDRDKQSADNPEDG